MIRAAIALGSNSTRMLCAALTPEGVSPLGRGREETLLFMGLDGRGRLSPEALSRAGAAVAALKAQAEALGCPPGQVDLYATSAVRDAANREELAALLRQSTGLEMRVISGEEEAALSFAAVSGGRRVLVLDIGGGSTELTFGEGGTPLASVSLQMGASRCLREHPIRAAEDARALSAALAERIRLEGHAVTGRAVPGSLPLVGIGGTCTACRDMLAPGSVLFPCGAALTAPAVALLRDLLAPMPPEDRRRFKGLPPGKAEHIVHGLCILHAALTVFCPVMAEVSVLNNLDGWLGKIAADLFPPSPV